MPKKYKAKTVRKARRYRRSTKYKADATGTCCIANGCITWTLPRKIRSLNVLKNGLARYSDTKSFETQIVKAEIISSDASLGPCSKQRLRLEIIRLAPNRNFYLDKTNLYGGCKGLEDALVRLEYLVDDCEEWEDGPYATQGISQDGKYWTIIKLMPPQVDAT